MAGSLRVLPDADGADSLATRLPVFSGLSTRSFGGAVSDQRNIVHKIMCGCDANQACPEWDRCLDAELAVREVIDHERDQRIQAEAEHGFALDELTPVRAHTESWPA